MGWMTKTRVKYLLAGIGAFYILAFFGYLVYAGTRSASPAGPSELEAHPERQAEIVSRRRAEELRDQLKLSEDQTRRIAEIYRRDSSDTSADTDPRERGHAQRKEIESVLTEEQKAQLEQNRDRFGGPGGPGGPGGRITPERIEGLKQHMTPEQLERFEKATQRMKQMREQGGPRGEQRGDGQRRGPGRGGRGPGRNPSGQQQ